MKQHCQDTLMLLQLLLVHDPHLFVHAIDGHLAVGHLSDALQVILSPCRRRCNPFKKQLRFGGMGCSYKLDRLLCKL